MVLHRSPAVHRLIRLTFSHYHGKDKCSVKVRDCGTRLAYLQEESTLPMAVDCHQWCMAEIRVNKEADALAWAMRVKWFSQKIPEHAGDEMARMHWRWKDSLLIRQGSISVLGIDHVSTFNVMLIYFSFFWWVQGSVYRAARRHPQWGFIAWFKRPHWSHPTSWYGAGTDYRS